jgi:hypothetical protein
VVGGKGARYLVHNIRASFLVLALPLLHEVLVFVALEQFVVVAHLDRLERGILLQRVSPPPKAV